MPEADGAPSREFVALQRAVAGRYSLVRELGRGGMAVVFLARDAELGRLVAIKLLREELVADPAARARFLAEARTAARLLHPNIVPVHVVEEAGELVFLVMAFVDGETLGGRVRRAGPLSPAGVRDVVRGVAWALAHAHDAGIVHLDVKPDNILLERDSGRPMLADFGIARLAREQGPGGDGQDPAGTPRYMSPEQLAGAPVDGRSDLYSLGVTAHFALTGRWPERADGGQDAVTVPGGGRLRLPPGRKARPSASIAGISPPLAAAIERCLSPEPAGRPRSAAALAAEVEDAEALPFHLPVAGRRLVHALRQFVLLAGAGGIALVLWPDPGLLAAGILTPIILWGLLRPARALRRAGYDGELLHDVVVEEVRGLFTDRNEGSGSRWKALAAGLREAAIGASPVLCGVTAAALGTAWALEPGLALGGTLAALGLAAAALFGAGPSAPAGSPLRHLDWGERLLVGRFGRGLLGIAGIGVPPPEERRRPLDRPTEVVLASAIEEMVRLLPAELQERLRDVSGVARRLERHVEGLRRRDAALAEAVGRVALPVDGRRSPESEALLREFERARVRLDERLREAVAALEHLRLRLHRLAVDATRPERGAATAPDAGPSIRALERDLDRAREVERTEAAATARDEGELRGLLAAAHGENVAGEAASP